MRRSNNTAHGGKNNYLLGSVQDNDEPAIFFRATLSIPYVTSGDVVLLPTITDTKKIVEALMFQTPVLSF